MSRYADKLFWIVMAVIVLVIAFLSYITFFYQTSPVQSTADENGLTIKIKKKEKEVRNLYVCAEGAVILSLPREGSKTIQSVKQGEGIAITGEEKDWLEVKMAGNKTGWIEKKYVCDQQPKPVEEVKKTEVKPEPKKEEPKTPQPAPAVKKPEPPKAPVPQAPPEYPPATTESMDTLVDGLFDRLNQRTQMQFGQALFDDHTMLDAGMRLEAKATSVWKIIPQNYKVQILQILSNQYTLIACNIAKVVNCTPNNTPAISIVDSSGHEIAYQNSSGSQVLE